MSSTWASVNSVPFTVATTVVKLASCAARGVDRNKVKAILRKILDDFAIVLSFEAHGITRAVDTVMQGPYID